MKIKLIIILFLFFPSLTYSAGKTWNTTDGNWSGNSNWLPSGSPAQNDDVFILLEDGANITMDISNGTTVASLNMNGEVNQHYLFLSGNMEITGSLTVNAIERIDLITCSMAVKGNISASGIIESSAGTGEIKLAGTTAQSLYTFDCPANIRIENTSATVSLSGDSSSGNFIISPGAVFSQGNNIFYVNGNMVVNGTFIKGDKVLQFNKAGLQSISVSENQNLGKVKVFLTGTVVSLLSSAKFETMAVNTGAIFKNSTAGTTITMDDNSFVSVTNKGTFVLAGASGNNIVWQPASSAFSFIPASGSTVNLSYAGIKGCSSSVEINAQNNCTDLGGNNNIDFAPPSAITNLSASSGFAREINLTWTAVGDDDNSGTAASYIVKYSTGPITTEAQFSAASIYVQSWNPLGAGNAEHKTLTGLTGGISYYVSIKAVDSIGVSGGLSNTTGNSAIALAASGKTWGQPFAGGWNWSDSFNWLPIGVPDFLSDVVIPVSEDAGELNITMDISEGTTIASLDMTSSMGMWQRLQLYGDMEIRGQLKVSEVKAIELGTSNLKVHGDVLSSAEIVSSLDNYLQLTGHLAQGLSTADVCSANIKISNTSDTVSLIGNSSCGDLIVDQEAVLVQGSSNLVLGGNVTVNGTYLKGTGTITFNKMTRNFQSVSVSNNQNLGAIITSSNTVVSLLNSARFDTMVIASGTAFKNNAAGTTVTIDNASYISVNKGSFLLTGSIGSNVVLCSDSVGSQFDLKVASGSTVSLAYASIKDCNAVGTELNAQNNCVNLGNNTNIDFYPPSAITNLTAGIGSNPRDISLTWTAVGDDTVAGTAISYIVKYSTGPITTDIQFDNANTYSQSWSPLESGQTETQTLSGLDSSVTYYISIKSIDNLGGIGGLSNTTGNSASAYSAGKTWNAGTGNWNVLGNWEPPGVPTEINDVIIPASVSTCTITMDIASGTTIASLRMDGTSGNSHTLNLSGNLKTKWEFMISFFNTMNLNTSNAVIERDVSVSGIINSSTGELQLAGTLSQNLYASNCTANIRITNTSSAVSISGDSSCKNLIIDSGATLNQGTNNIAVRGNIIANGTYIKGTGILTFNGGGVQFVSVAGNQHLGKVSLSTSSTVVSLLNNAKFENITVGNDTVFKNNAPGTTITIDDNGSVTINGTLTLSGSNWGAVSSVAFTNSGSTNKFVLSKQTGATINLTYVSLTGCTGVSASSVLDLSAGSVNNLGNNANIIFPSRSWNYGGLDNWTAVNRWTPPNIPDILDNVVVNTSSSNLTNASGVINSLAIGISNNSTLSNAGSSVLTVLGTLTVGSSGYITNANLNLKGNMVSSRASLMINNLTVSGNSSQTLSLPDCFINSTLSISNTSAVVTLNNSPGTILFCKEIAVNSNATLQINSQTIRITGKADFNGTLIANTSTTLIFYRASMQQNLTANDNTLGHLLLKGSAGVNTLNLLNSARLYSLTIEQDAKFRMLNAGTTLSIGPSGAISVQTGGSFVFAGISDNRSILKSFTSGQTFKFNREDENALVKFAYADISDCNAGSGIAVTLPNNCSTLNCFNFIFDALINTRTWTGLGGSAWSSEGNWNPSGSPVLYDDIIIPNGTVLGAYGTIASITLTGAAELSLSNLTVSGRCAASDGCAIKGGSLYVKGDLSGYNVQGSGNLYLNGNSLQSAAWNGKSWNITVNNISSYGISASDNLSCSNFTLNSGSNFTVPSANDVSIAGSIVLNGISSFGNNLHVTGSLSSGGTCMLGSGITYAGGGLTVNSGSFYQNLSSLNISGNVNVKSGIFTHGLDLNIAGNLTVGGYFNEGSGNINLSGPLASIASGKFNKGTGTIKFLGAVLQKLNANNNDLGKVEISNSNTAVSLISNVKFSSLLISDGASLICKTNDKIVTLGDASVNGTLDFSGSRITLSVLSKPDNGIAVSSSGKFNLTGTTGAGNYAALLSNQSGNQFKLTTSNTENVSLKYAKIKDCDASSGSQIEGIACLDLGNNNYVFFGAQPPAPINNLQLKQTAGSGNLEVKWTAVGTEGNSGKAKEYIVKYSSVNITTQVQFDSAQIYAQIWSPKIVGENESYIITGLPAGTDIWFVSIETKNFAGLNGDISQISEFVVQIDPTRHISYSLPGERGNVNIEIPQGAFTQNVEITGRELNSSQMPAVSQPEFKSTGLGASFSVSAAEKIKQPLKLKIKYDEKDIEGLNADKLKIAFYNDAMGKWYHVKSKTDTVSKSVSAELKHLTTFRVVEYTYLGLSTVKVFPNPWKIGTAGNFDNGEMTFKNLPEKGRIRIYNVAGEMVKDINITEADDGFYSWNGTNDAGNKVSSGVYLAYVEDNEGNHRIMKVAIIR